MDLPRGDRPRNRWIVCRQAVGLLNTGKRFAPGISIHRTRGPRVVVPRLSLVGATRLNLFDISRAGMETRSNLTGTILAVCRSMEAKTAFRVALQLVPRKLLRKVIPLVVGTG